MNNGPKKTAPAAGSEKKEPQKTTRGTIVVTGDDDGAAFHWVLVNLAISFVVLLAVNMMEKRKGGK